MQFTFDPRKNESHERRTENVAGGNTEGYRADVERMLEDVADVQGHVLL